MSLGYLQLGVLSALAALAALAVAVRVGCRGRAETFVAACMLWNALIITPIYALGLTHRLYRTTLGWVSLLWFSAVLAATFARIDRRAFAERLRRTAIDLVRMPWDGVREAIRQRSVVTLGLVFVVVIVGWTTVMSWYLASWGQWDALWYHEPMIGFALQNHGFDMVALPADVQKINGYPRLVEMTQLWFVAFTDRRLVEVLNSLMAPVLVVSVYLLARRYTRDRVQAMGWGAALLVLPVCSKLMQTAYVDVMSAIYVLAAVHFATRQELRIADVLLGAMCLALAVGSKIMALVPVGIVGPIALVRLIAWHARKRPWATTAAGLAGTAMIFAIGASTYLRNYLHFHNPLWPDFKYDNPKLGIHWPGSLGWTMGGGPGGVGSLSMNLPMDRFFDDLTSIPYSKTGSFYYESFEYSFVLAWLILPLASVALTCALAGALGSVIERYTRLRLTSAASDTRNLLLLAIPTLGMLYTTPALWAARYNIAPVGMMMVAIAWLGGRRGFHRLGEAAVGFAVIGSIIAFFWCVPRWYYTPSELSKVMKIPYPRREMISQPQIASGVYLARGSAITEQVGLARERELGPGDVIVFDDAYGGFPALFWNNRYTNQVVYVPTSELLAGADRLGAKWVYCSYSDPNIHALRAPGSGWEEVGMFNVEGWGATFRRVPKP